MAMSRRALLLTLLFAIALLGLSLIVGFRDYDQSVVVAPDSIASPSGPLPASPGGTETVVLHCPGPLASIASMGAYYPISGHIVSPRLGVQPMPCLIKRGRLQLEVWIAVVVSLIIGMGAALALRRLARHPKPGAVGQSPVEAEATTS